MSRMHQLLLTALLLATGPGISAETIHRSHAIAMHGEPAYQQDFQHFSYINPDAPKGGTIRLASQGNFDSLNPFIARGNPAANLGLIYDTLTIKSGDEPFTYYGLLAKSIEWPQDRSWVKYTLREEARFHDGKPVTAADVKFTFELLMEHGTPAYKSYYSDVEHVEVLSEYEIRFRFKSGDNKEMVLTMGELPVLPQHFWQDKEFDKASLDIPLGSGPYRISNIDVGRSIRFERVDDYWAQDLPVKRGKYNFQQIRIDYYRDSTVMLEALKAGQYDLRRENVARQWATGYTGGAINRGELKTISIEHQNPTGMQAFVMNLRNPLFEHIKVRKALNYAFDYEWTNDAMFYGTYTRSDSFFSNSELASSGLPSEAELALLKPLQDKLPETVFKQPFSLPETDGSGNNRDNLRKARQLLEEAGWQIRDGQLTNDNGQVFRFEFLLFDPAFERIINPYIRSLRRLGIQATIRQVEMSQFINRLRSFNFDVVVHTFPQSLSPGTEQLQYWHSSSADMQASRNIAGIKDEAVDALVEQLVRADSREQLVTASHALDRVLLHNWYVIPQWHIDTHRIAFWDKFGLPDTAPKYDPSFHQAVQTWWFDEQKAARLRR